MRPNLFLALGLTILFLATSLGQAQFPGGGGRGGGGDPDQMFSMLSGGKDVIVRSDLNPRLQSRFDQWAQQLGITNGEITRQQFAGMMQQRLGGQGGGGGPGGGQGRGSGMNNPDAMANLADRWFASLDKNGDGVLNTDEMPEALRVERDKWDTDHNGLIDLNEFRAYFTARLQQRLADRQSASDPNGTDDNGAAASPSAEEARPTVYRYGNLPKELPAWFTELDTDKDGQVGLYEWKVSGRPIEEFTKMDRNGDGFLTVDEVLYTQREGARTNSSEVAGNGPSNGDTGFAPGRGRNGLGQGGRGGRGNGGNGRGNGGGGRGNGGGGNNRWSRGQGNGNG
jgi:Ca2+-binding EF-hand superfamily protein